MTTNLALKYDQPVPRYTSYPTAPHFQPDIDARTYRRWLGELAPGTRLSLYLHVPFCRSMCWFCGCHTRIAKNYTPVAHYLETLESEIELVAAALPEHLEVVRVHWGGGSPTLLAPQDWSHLMNILRANFPFAGTTDVAVELDPRTTSAAFIETLAATGVGRVSIGVQDFDPAVQQAVNRRQSFGVTACTVHRLRAHGIKAINFDLMYGLPHQTTFSVARTARRAVDLAPARIALFGYAHVPEMKPHQRRLPEEALPGAAARFAQAAAAADILTGAGYRRIGLDHFARPDDPLCRAADTGSLRRNFQGYTDDDAAVCLGLGASSIGRLPQGYVQNTAAIPAWRQAVEAGDLPIARGRRLTAADRLRADLIERLMCDLQVNVAEVAIRHGAAPAAFKRELAALSALVADGLVDRDGDTIRITERGRPFVRLAAAAFDDYLETRPARHARL